MQTTWENVLPASFGSGPSLSSLLRNADISVKVQNHLVNVYLSLAATMACASFGTVFYFYTHLSPFLASIGMMLAMFGLQFGRDLTVQEKLPRLFLFGFLQGASVGGLVELAMYVDSMLVAQAFVVTVLIFGCFAAVATFSQRRSYLYLYGMLASGLSWLVFASLMNIFFQSRGLFDASTYLGLTLFMGYVVADTQMIIERADMGDPDYVRHALELFIDLAGIFVRLLIIFLRSSENARQRADSKRRRRG